MGSDSTMCMQAAQVRRSSTLFCACLQHWAFLPCRRRMRLHIMQSAAALVVLHAACLHSVYPLLPEGKGCSEFANCPPTLTWGV